MKLIRIDMLNYYINQNLIKINLFNILFMLNIDGLIVIHVNIND